MTLRLLPYLAVLLLVLTQCRKKNDPAPGTPGAPRLSRITNESGQLLAEFGYRPDGKLSNYKQYSAGVSLPNRTEDYAYDAQGRLERVDVATAIGNILTRSEEVMAYTSAGKVETVTISQVSGTQRFPSAQIRLEYDASGRVSKSSLLGASNGTYALSSYDTYAYDGRGNVTKTESFFANNQPLSRLTFEYDTRPNPFRTAGRMQWAASYQSPNNATREKYEYLGPAGGTSPNYDRPITYQYNGAGYPTQATQDGIVFKYVYE
jgi:hypothetical protein